MDCSLTFIIHNDSKTPLVLVGDKPELGSWAPSKGVTLQNDPRGTPQWVCSMWMPVKSRRFMQFKFVQKIDKNNNKTEYVWENIPNRYVMNLQPGTQNLVVGGFGQSEFLFQSSKLPSPASINIKPVSGLYKIVVPYWFHDIHADIKVHFQGKMFPGVNDAYNGRAIASFKIDQPIAKTNIDWTSVEHGTKKTSVISIFPLRHTEMVLTPWHGDKKLENLDDGVDSGYDIDTEEGYKEAKMKEVYKTRAGAGAYSSSWGDKETVTTVMKTTETRGVRSAQMGTGATAKPVKDVMVKEVSKTGQKGPGSGGDINTGSTVTKTKTTTVRSSQAGTGTRGPVTEVMKKTVRTGEEGSSGWGDEETITTVKKTETTSVRSSQAGTGAKKQDVETTSSSWSQAGETAEADEMMRSEQEETKRFVITGVRDPRTDEPVSMQEAIRLGIINNNAGTYVNPKTREAIPIPEAMNRGLILVEFVSAKRTEEKKQDIGLITIKTTKETRPYAVHTVVDAKTDQHMTVDEAIDRKILDQNKGVYIDGRTNTEMSLADAIDSGLLLVEFDETAPVGKPQQIVKTYAIHGIVDARRKMKIPFSQAVKLNLFDKETGVYYNNLTRQKIYVGEAIKKGFVKATVVKDPSSLDIDPENKMVVEKLDILRKKLLKPMIAMAALRKAAVQTPPVRKAAPTAKKGSRMGMPLFTKR